MPLGEHMSKLQRCGCNKPHREHETGCRYDDLSDEDLAAELEALAVDLENVHTRTWMLHGALCDYDSKIARELTSLTAQIGFDCHWFKLNRTAKQLRG